MDLTSTQDGSTARISVSGDVDSDTSPQLHDAFTQAFADGVTDVVVNVAGVSFLSSAGLSVLISAHREAAHFALVPGNRIVDRLIALTGLSMLYGNDETEPVA